MKKFIKFSFTIALCVAAMTSCNCYTKMAKSSSDVSALCTPEILTLTNGKVSADVTLEFPANYFNKKAVLRVTPVMVYEGGELASDPFFLQGESIDGNYKIVDFASGAKVIESVEFDYKPEMRRSKLQLRVEVLCGCSDCDGFVLFNAASGALATAAQLDMLAADATSEESLKLLRACGFDVADGVNTLEGEIEYASIMESVEDNFKRVTTTVEKADLAFGISSSVVKSSVLSSDEIKALEQGVAGNVNNDRATQTLYANGYASPDGPEKFNEKLSKDRSASAKRALSKMLADYGVEIDEAAYGEDWDGFKELVEQSDIAEKGLILQVLSLHDSSAKRETEIKNLANVFNELKTDILPQLRRAQVTNLVELSGKTDEEMLALVEEGNFSALSADEALYIEGNLKVNGAKKCAMLESVAAETNDARVYNNLGIAYTATSKKAKAMSAFEKALELGYKGDEISKNMALANLNTGNLSEAKKFATSADEETQGVIAAYEGDYSKMAKSATGYNAAVAYTKVGNYAAAKKALGSLNNAKADYLRAVIASLEGDIKSAAESLKSAIKKNEKLAEKAESDVNLKNLYDAGDQI